MRRLIAMISIILGLVLAGGQPVHAANGSRFTLTPVLNASNSKKTGIFDIVARPGSQVQVAGDVTNLAASKRTVQVQITNAGITENGQIDYTPAATRDKTLHQPLTSMTTGKQVITLAAKQTKRVTFTLKIPQQGFQGMKLGALYAIDPQTYGGSDKGVSLANRFSMYTAINLRTSKKYVRPAVKVSKVHYGQQHHQAAVIARLQNPRPELFGQMTVKTQITKQGDQKVLLKRTAHQQAMAPNAHYDFATLAPNGLRAGQYTLQLKAQSGTRRWHFKRHFTVTKQQATTVDSAASITTPGTPWYVWVLIGLAIVIIVLLAGLLWRRRQAKQH